MNETTGKDEQGFNEPFDDWLRAMKPPVPDSSLEKKAFLDEFREKMMAEKLARKNRLQRNVKRGSIAMSLAVLCVLTFNLTDLGSDGFDMVEVEDAETQGGVVKNVFRGDGFNVLEGETEQDLREINQEFSSQEGIVIGLEGWEILGKVDWWIIREFDVFGEKEQLASEPMQSNSSLTKKHAQFYSEKWSQYESAIKNGEMHSNGKATKTIDGILFTIDIWSFPVPGFEEIKYYKGVPIH